MHIMNRFFLLGLVGCAPEQPLDDYYAGKGSPPQVTGISAVGEDGNVGGGQVTVYGRNFGADTQGVTVVFGSRNAEIISVGKRRN